MQIAITTSQLQHLNFLNTHQKSCFIIYFSLGGGGGDWQTSQYLTPSLLTAQQTNPGKHKATILKNSPKLIKNLLKKVQCKTFENW